MPAITVRMSDEDMDLLRRQAAAEHRSMNDVAVLAIRDRHDRTVRQLDDREAIARLIDRHAGTLDRLAE